MRNKVKGIIPPPLILLMCLILGFLLDQIWPADVLSGYLWIRIAIAGHLIFISGIMALHAFRQMKKVSTQIGFDSTTTVLITDGSFRISRNPLYLSLMILFLAITLLIDSLWFFIILGILMFIFNDIAKSEERYLESEFGEVYLNYKNKVRRWI